MAIREEGVLEHRWDGGAEYFQRQNERKQKIVWGGVDDIKPEKKKTHVQSKNKKRKRAGQRKVYSRQETVVYFPKSDKESTNRG